ncbi:MAG: hypothetical protein KBD94_03490 [Pyrinomonadaceae bacterium]|nr:hypothetical protein [Pyrinomonadaceae bacterium]
MARSWEEYDEPGSPRIADLHVSLSPTGTFLVSRNAYEALGSPTHIVLKIEKATRTIGIQPVPPSTVNGFKLYDSKRSGAYRFHALRFMVKYNIQLKYTVRFPTARIEDGILLLELKYRVRSPRAVRPLPSRTGWKKKG